MSWPRSSSRDGEGGSVLPLVALSVVTLMICAGLAVDMGSVAATNRRLQGVADLAASAGALELTGDACNFSYKLSNETVPRSLFDRVREAAVANAAKNGFPAGATRSLVVEVGILQYDNDGKPTFQPTHSTLTGADCMVSSVPAAVRVTAGDHTRFAFGQVMGRDGMTTYRSGTAGRKNQFPCVDPTACPPKDDPGDRRGSFEIGSWLANVDSSNSQVLTAVLDEMVCKTVSGCSFSTTLVGYQGLAASSITLGDLAAKLGAGSVDSLLDTSYKAGDLYLASAKALGCNQKAGCSNAAAVTLFDLAAGVNSTTTFKLRNMITVDAGSHRAALATRFNVFRLVTGSAQLINGTNTVSVPVTSVTIPGATSTTLSVKVTEVPQTYIGPVGGSVSTSQAVVTAIHQINLTNIASSLGLTNLTGSLPVTITAGSAKGTLAQVECAPNKGQTVSVDTTGAAAAIGDPNTANKFLTVKDLLGATLATVNVNATASVAGVNGNLLSFSYPGEYLPATPNPKQVGGTTLNVQGTTMNVTASLLGLGLDVSAVTTQLTGPTGTLTTLDTQVVSPVLRALGIRVAGADVWALGKPECLGGAPHAGPPRQ